MALSRRDHLVETAAELFRRNGYHATGIDRILAESGCAKMTLYKHFRSKDELILAALRRRDEQFRNALMRAVERRAESPRGRLLAVFERLGELIAEPDFSGCMFVNAAGRSDPCRGGRAQTPDRHLPGEARRAGRGRRARGAGPRADAAERRDRRDGPCRRHPDRGGGRPPGRHGADRSRPCHSIIGRRGARRPCGNPGQGPFSSDDLA